MIKDGKIKISPATAGVAGAVAGAALGSAASVYLSKAENREKIGETVSSVKNRAVELVAEAKKYPTHLHGIKGGQARGRGRPKKLK